MIQRLTLKGKVGGLFHQSYRRYNPYEHILPAEDEEKVNRMRSRRHSISSPTDLKSIDSPNFVPVARRRKRGALDGRDTDTAVCKWKRRKKPTMPTCRRRRDIRNKISAKKGATV